jgi:hypothetical protein
MYNTPQDLLGGYRATPKVLDALLQGVTQEQAKRARGGDEGWSVVEVVCHLRDAEERALERCQAMRDQVNPSLPGYDQEAWARERNYAAADLQQALKSFITFRERHVAALEALAPAAWERTGQHSEMGTVTILGHTAHMVGHDLVHMAQIVRQLGR